MNIFTHNNIGTVEERGDDANATIYSGIELINSVLRTTLGPKGSYKVMDAGNKIYITNDGATILKNLVIDNPAAKLLIDASVSQDWEEGDGTTSIAVLATELLLEAKKLNIPRVSIIRGYELALKHCLNKLEELSIAISNDSDSEMINLARTTICSKVLKCDLQHFSKLCVDAIKKLENENDLNLIQIIKTSGNLEESYLSDGFILNKDVEVEEMENVSVLVANTSLDADKVKIYGAKINVDSLKSLSEIETAEKEKMQKKIEKITSIPFKCFVNRQIIYDYPLELLKQKKINVVEHADFDGVERLNKFLGGKIVSSFENLTEDSLGKCTKVKNITIGNDRMVLFENTGKKAVTIVLKGSSKEVLDEAERSIHDALCVLNKLKEEKKVIYGGGATEMELFFSLQDLTTTLKDKESESILAFANALQQIPVILAENGGLDFDLIKAKLRAEHKQGNTTFGVDFNTNSVGCMRNSGVLESLRTKRRVLIAATEMARMILKTDGFIKCKPRERTRE